MDTITKHTSVLRDRIEETLRENIVLGAGASMDRIVDALMATVAEVSDKRTLVITCSLHGEIAREEVWCGHDNEEAMRRVATAHGASYGAGCQSATLNVEIIGP